MADSDKLAKDQDKFVLRMPDGMRGRIALRAKMAGRSMNSEIIGLIEKALEDGDAIDILWAKVERIEGGLEDLDSQVNGPHARWRPAPDSLEK